MNKKIRRQLLLRALLTSPIISLLVTAPMYLIKTNPQNTFLVVWSKIMLVTLLCWALQVSIFSFFKKRAYPNWQYLLFFILFMIVLTFATNPFAPQNNEFMKSASNISVMMLRFSLASAINLMIYLIIDLLYTHEKRIQLIEENAMLQYNNLETEYQLLKSQINPHFLFNALNISKSLIKTQPKTAEKYIIQLSEFLRKSLNNEQKAIPLRQELAHCNQYIDLQKVRFEHAIHYTVNIDNIHLDKHLPFFALITLAENAIKHNAFSAENPLTISIEIVDDFLNVKNNINVKKGVISSNIGLESLNQRSKMVSNTEIEIENDGQHFSVKVKLIEQ